MARQPYLSLGAMLGLIALAVFVQGQGPVDGAAPTASDAVLVAADPPLTREMVDAFGGFFEWLLDVPLTAAQRQQLEATLVGSWQANNREEIQGALDILALDAQVAQLGEAERALVREQAQPAVLDELRQDPNDEGAKWVLSLYEAGHQPLAPGDPPLTRQVTDACAEMLCFIIGELIGEPFPSPVEFRDEVAKLYAADYTAMTAEQQQDLSATPMQWAALRVAWSSFSDEEKAAYRSQWTESFKGMIPEQSAEAQPPADKPAEAVESESAQGTGSATSVQEMLAQQRRAAIMSNMLQMQHETSMAIISNIGGGGWRYEYRY